jgi:hypothetical protein
VALGDVLDGNANFGLVLRLETTTNGLPTISTCALCPTASLGTKSAFELHSTSSIGRPRRSRVDRDLNLNGIVTRRHFYGGVCAGSMLRGPSRTNHRTPTLKKNT